MAGLGARCRCMSCQLSAQWEEAVAMGAARWPGWLERRREGVNSEGFTLPSSSGSASLKLTATAHWKATSCRVCIVWRLRPCMLHMRNTRFIIVPLVLTELTEE